MIVFFMKKFFKFKFIIFIIGIFFGFNSIAHQGGLNTEGCHTNKKNGDYHCHKKDIEIRKDGFRVIDGDTVHFDFDNRKVRFNGIDAPEIGQICINAEGPFDCGLKAKEILINFIGSELPICISEGLDNFSREISECFVNGESISKFLVRNGYAFAYRKYSKKFIEDEDYARQNNLGLWKTKFEFPWDYR